MVETTVRGAHTPDKIMNVHDMLLVGFDGEDDGRAPSAEAFSGPSVGFEYLQLLDDDLAFMGPIMWLLAADGRGGAGVNCEFEVQDRKLDAGAMEAVPVRLDDVDNGSANFWGDVDADDKVLGKFREVTLALPDMLDIGADVDEGFRRVVDDFAELFKLKDALIDVVGVIHGNILVNGLGSPNLRQYFDFESTGGDSGDGRRSLGNERGQRSSVVGRDGSRIGKDARKNR